MEQLTALNPPEKSRTYFFPNGEVVRLLDVTHFLARESGNHRLKTADGLLHIVNPGWLRLTIEADAFTL